MTSVSNLANFREGLDVLVAGCMVVVANPAAIQPSAPWPICAMLVLAEFPTLEVEYPQVFLVAMSAYILLYAST